MTPVRQARSPVVSEVPDSVVVVAAVDVHSSVRPARYPVTATATTLSWVNASTETSLATSSRVRPTGRTSRYRRVPAAASPAIASPATTATAIGRKNGRTIPSAAAGYSDPLPRTAESSVGPSPGRGAIFVTERN